MRLKGVIKSWNDERGFGFIEPALGGEEIFFHITAFPQRAGRPQVSQRVLFEVEPGRRGKLRARSVELSQSERPAKKIARDSETQHGTGTLVFIPAFVLVYLVAFFLWEPPIWFALIYLVASAVTYLVYANDKSCAERGAWRTKESVLHILSLAGGWPGALLAQQLLRHKSAKAEFRLVFWATVVMNVAAFIGFCSYCAALPQK
jgi:uncharacterized membrane protein YsdA (DUF1294 family)/cold shock CspA family protein